MYSHSYFIGKGCRIVQGSRGPFVSWPASKGTAQGRVVSVHTGKVPARAVSRKSLHDRLTALEGELDNAIKSERYEDAARFRDEILNVKQAFAPKAEGESLRP
jgi:hypothetical protein